MCNAVIHFYLKIAPDDLSDEDWIIYYNRAKIILDLENGNKKDLPKKG